MEPRLLSRWGRSLWFGVWLGTTSAGACMATSCAFVLDFTAFEGCAECSDTDRCKPGPCIQNGCFPEPDGGPVCEPPPDVPPARCKGKLPGTLSAIREFAPLRADSVLQTEVLTTNTRIYQTAFIRNEDQTHDVVVRAFDVHDTATDSEPQRPLATVRLSDLLAGKPEAVVAPGVLVAPQADTTGELALFTAIAEPSYLGGYVVRLNLTVDLEPIGEFSDLTEFPNFLIEDSAGRKGPAAQLLADGQPFVVWQGCKPNLDAGTDLQKDPCKSASTTSGHVAVFSYSGKKLDNVDLSEQGIPEDVVASSLQALGGGPLPAAVWAGHALDTNRPYVKVGLPTLGTQAELVRCTQDRALWLHASPPVKGAVSSVVWSSQSAAEATRVQCSDEQCRDMLNAPDSGDTETCSPTLISDRVVLGASYLVHGVWGASNGDENAYTVSAYVQEKGDDRTLVATVTRGTPDPNQNPLVDVKAPIEILSTAGPRNVALSVQPYSSTATRATATVGVSWIDGTNTARLSGLDLCLDP